MTLCIQNVTKEEAEKFLLADPVLCERALPDDELDMIQTCGEYSPNENANFIGICHDGLLISVTKWEYFTDVTANLHTYIMSPLHGKNVTYDIQLALKQWFITNTPLVKIVIIAPESCTNVHKAADISDFVLEGVLPKSVLWRGKVEGLRIYGLDLDRLRS